MSRNTIAAAVVMLIGIGASSAAGGIYEGTITGELTYVRDNVDVPGIVVGAPIALSYIFDSESPDRLPAYEGLGRYDLVSWRIEIGPEYSECLTECGEDYIEVENDDYNDFLDITYDSYSIGYLRFSPSDASFVTNAYIVLVDETASVLADDRLPTSLDSANFNVGYMYTIPDCFPGRCSAFDGEIHTVNIRPIPEPSVGVLLIAGTVTLLAQRRVRAG